MEFKKAVGLRRTIRYFAPWHPVEKGKVQAILEAARLQSQHANVNQIRKAVVVTKGETSDEVRDAIVDACYSQPQVQQAPVIIVWTVDMSGWESMRDGIDGLMEARALNSTHGWSKEFVEEVVMPNADFNVMAGDQTFAEWLSAFEAGLAVGSALLAAVDEGLGTALVTGRRDDLRTILGMPEHVTVTQVQLVGYPAESADAGGQRPRAPFDELYFKDTWGKALDSDPATVERLKAEGMIQEPAPLPWRSAEITAMAELFGMPE